MFNLSCSDERCSLYVRPCVNAQHTAAEHRDDRSHSDMDKRDAAVVHVLFEGVERAHRP